jgi:hypothetical protein
MGKHGTTACLTAELQQPRGSIPSIFPRNASKAVPLSISSASNGVCLGWMGSCHYAVGSPRRRARMNVCMLRPTPHRRNRICLDECHHIGIQYRKTHYILISLITMKTSGIGSWSSSSPIILKLKYSGTECEALGPFLSDIRGIQPSDDYHMISLEAVGFNVLQ